MCCSIESILHYTVYYSCAFRLLDDFFLNSCGCEYRKSLLSLLSYPLFTSVLTLPPCEGVFFIVMSMVLEWVKWAWIDFVLWKLIGL